MIGIKILQAISLFFYVYMIMICVRCLLTWIPGPFDLSPVVAMIVLILIEKPVIWIFAVILNLLGLLK